MRRQRAEEAETRLAASEASLAALQEEAEDGAVQVGEAGRVWHSGLVLSWKCPII